MFICWSPPPYGNIWSPTKKEKKDKKDRNENRKGGREEVSSSSHRGYPCGQREGMMMTPVGVHHDTRTVPITTSTEQEPEEDRWEVVHVTDQDFETTEGEAEDVYDKLMTMTGWTPTVTKT
jgi:hypothetical protein